MQMRRGVALLVATVSVVAVACGSSSPAAAVSTPAASTIPTPPAASPTPVVESAAPLRVVALDLTANPADHVGACPIEITFSAHISVTGAGTVSYKWISSDGDASDVKTLTFTGPGSRNISSTWTVNRDTVPTHAGWSSIDIISPASAAASSSPSAQAAFVFTCDADDDIEAIGFGIGGSDADCSIAKILKTFAPTDPVRVVANYWPSLAAGTKVTFQLSRDDVPVDGYPLTITLHETSKCVRGTVSPGVLPPGHYRLDVIPDNARAVSGEFDTK